MDNKITVEVVYALPHHQTVISVEVPKSTTAYDAVLQSGIAGELSVLDLEKIKMGIFGRLLTGRDLPKSYQVENGDRIEIYRDLIVDPKLARRKRAERQTKTPDI